MFENDAYLEDLILKDNMLEILKVQNEVEELFREAIYQKVYLEHTEGESYKRTGQLLESVKSKVTETDEIIIYNDTSELDYMSWVTSNKSPQGAYVPSWMQNGHGGLAQVVSRNFLEEAKRLIDAKYNCNCEIINEDDELSML